MSELSIKDAEDFYEKAFPPWVKALDISFTHVEKNGVTLRIPASPALNRMDGIMCGQAIMALADTAMVFSVAAFVGEFINMTTINLQTSFLRPVVDSELFADARIIKPGRTIMYGEVNLHTGNTEKPVGHVIGNFMLL
ncbi:PaaI family thioesterase [Sneathiella marina]|uniref:PaaI family thioesterase n=1 Tax=Sneathiella marina TaxID=2950108 RepID=A0ABY4W3M6_9PROT|nr:PaaI family thioesterase [Sneathiella marina]USG59899.1 PaaI family thioesterase [Sneathiella marina]